MKPNHRLPQLSAARPRSGVRSFAELVECLVRVYEKQNEVETGMSSASGQRDREPRLKIAGGSESMPALQVQFGTQRQTTFGFYDPAIG
jgi:hypothetical protein